MRWWRLTTPGRRLRVLADAARTETHGQLLCEGRGTGAPMEATVNGFGQPIHQKVYSTKVACQLLQRAVSRSASCATKDSTAFPIVWVLFMVESLVPSIRLL